MTEKPALKRARSNPILAIWRLGKLVLFLIYHILYLVVNSLGKEKATVELQASRQGINFGRGLLRTLGIRMTVTGPKPPMPALLAPNHMGYLDILVMMGAVECFMLTRSEVASWPLLGRVITKAGHPQIKRARSRALASAGDAAGSVLERGDRICIFLEGTSTGHDRVLPFHPAMIQPAIKAGAAVVPVGIRWKSIDPDIDLAEDVSYWKDHIIGPHLWRLCGLKGIEVEVQFGEPIPTTDRDRKSLAVELREKVTALSGLPAIDEPGWKPPESLSD